MVYFVDGTIGLPSSKREKAVCLVSGGIDSPVAAALVSKRYEIIPLHFCLYPYYCRGSFETVVNVLGKLQEKTGFKETIMFPHAEVLAAATRSGYREYTCVLCRRAMLKAAELVAEGTGASVIVTGESLGQKASQTLPNLWATSRGLKHAVLRPLIGRDKNEIIAASKGLGMPGSHAGCCTVTPDRPKTNAEAAFVDGLYEKLGIQKIIKDNFRKMLRIKELKGSAYSYLNSFLEATA